MRAPARLARLVASAIVVATTSCRSYFLADDPADAGIDDARQDSGTADGSVGAAKTTRIYVFGGSPDAVTLPAEPTALYAEILPDGLLSPWQAAPKPPASMIWHSSARGKDFIALLSGIAPPHGGNLKIFLGAVADGEITHFVSSPDLFAHPIHHGAALIHGDALYVMGGESGDNKPPTAEVWRGMITATTYTAPVEIAPLPVPVSRMAMAEGAGSVFLVGGVTLDNTTTGSILRARFDSDGSLSTFEAQSMLPSPRRHAAAAVHRSALFVVGGQDENDIANVLTCAIESSGNLAPCIETTPLPESRSRHRALVHEGRLYVVGGRGEDGGQVTFVGDLNAEGGVTRWRTTAPLPTPAVFAAAILL